MQEKNASKIYKLGYIIRLYKNSVYLCAKNIKVQGSGFRVQRFKACTPLAGSEFNDTCSTFRSLSFEI